MREEEERIRSRSVFDVFVFLRLPLIARVFFRLSLSFPLLPELVLPLSFPLQAVIVPEITTSAPPPRDRRPSVTSNVRTKNSFTCFPSASSWMPLPRSTAKAHRRSRASEGKMAAAEAAAAPLSFSSPGGGTGVSEPGRIIAKPDALKRKEIERE